MSSSFRGIFTIPSTPFRETGEIDIPSFRRIVDFCVECGAHGLVFPVNASEWTLLSDDERFRLSEVLVEQNAGRIPVVIGVAAASREIATRFAKHANEIGANAVIAMPPHIRRKALTEDVIFEYFRAISDVAQVPIFIQDWYGPIGTELSSNFMLRLCREIEHVQYIKEETEPSTLKLTEVVNGNDGSVKGFFGGSGGRFLIEEYRRGVGGNMPGCHVTDVLVALWNALEAGDEAQALYIYKELSPLFFFEAQVEGCYKEVLYRRGIIDCPLKRNGATQIDTIASDYLFDLLEALDPLMSWGKARKQDAAQAAQVNGVLSK